MKIKFPSLDKVVSKNKSLTVDNIRQYIFVHNGFAMTFDKPVFIVNLREYVKRECSIEEEDFETLNAILEYLEGKAIPAAAWKELTKTVDVEFNDEIIINKVDHQSVLILKENNIGIQYFKKEIEKYIRLLSSPSIHDDFQAYSGGILKTMSSVFDKEIQSSVVSLTRCEGTPTVKYQLSNKNYIFGLFNIDQDTKEQMQSMTAEMDIQELVTELRIGLSNLGFVEPVKAKVHDHPFQMSEPEDDLFQD